MPPPSPHRIHPLLAAPRRRFQRVVTRAAVRFPNLGILRLRTISTESSFLSSFLHRRALVSFIATSRLWRTSLSSRASLTFPLSYSSPTCQAVSIPLDSHYSGHCTTGHHPSIYACMPLHGSFIYCSSLPATHPAICPICGLLFLCSRISSLANQLATTSVQVVNVSIDFNLIIRHIIEN